MPICYFTFSFFPGLSYFSVLSIPFLSLSISTFFPLFICTFLSFSFHFHTSDLDPKYFLIRKIKIKLEEELSNERFDQAFVIYLYRLEEKFLLNLI